ncbi:MAG: RHS repeat-associated core domain-containing protein [Acidimicrobiales bacterium]
MTDANEPARPPRVVTFSYGPGDVGPDLTEVVDVTGGRTSFAYDADHRMTRMRLPNQYDPAVPIESDPEVVANVYDPTGRVIAQSDPLGRTTTFDYSAVPGSTKVTEPPTEDAAGNPVSHVSLDTYENGLLVSQTIGYGTSQAATWTREYEGATLGCTKVTDPNDQAWTSTFDAAGNRTSSTDPLLRKTTWSFTAKNLVATVVDPRGNQPGADPELWTTTFSYDDAGCGCNLLRRSRPLLDDTGSAVIAAQVVELRYGERGNHPTDLTTVVDPLSKEWRTDYDEFGYPAVVTDPLGHVTKATFDRWGRKLSETAPRGNLTSTPDPAFTSEFAFAQDNRVLATSMPNPPGAPITTAATYDANRNLGSFTDGNGNTTNYDYDAADQARFVRRADGTTLETRYWPDGSLEAQVDGSGAATRYFPDPFGRPATVIDPLGRATVYRYDPAGNRTSKQDHGGDCRSVPKHGCTTYGYDVANQMTSITYSDATTPDVTDIAYDANGARRSMTEVSKASPAQTSTSTWRWDSLDRLVSSTDTNGATVGYSHDLRDAVKTIAYPGGDKVVTRAYDDAGRWTSVTDWRGNTSTFAYDEDRNLTSAAASSASVFDYFSYDNAGRMDSAALEKWVVSSRGGGLEPLTSLDYGRDGAGQVTSVAATGLPADDHGFGYTALNQLATDSAAPDPYRYDGADNLTQRADGKVQVFDAANQLTAASGISVVGAGGAADTTSSSLTAPLPADLAASDQILVAATLPASRDASTPSGYVPVGSWSSGTESTDAKVQVFRRTATGGETAATVSFRQKYAKSLNVVVYRGVDPTSPIDAAPVAATAAGATEVTSPSVTTTAMADRLVMVMAAASAPTAGAWTPPTSMTRRGAQQSAGSAISAAVADTVVPLAGPAGAQHAAFTPAANLVGVALALKPATSTTFTYDSRGNRTTGPGGTSLTYDQANRLVGAGTTTYGYDGGGLRMRKTTDTGGGTASTVNFVWDQSGALPLLLADGDTTYIYGPGGLPVAGISATGEATFYHHDQLGSTRALTDSSGAVLATFTYDAYGQLQGRTGSATTPFGFAGEYSDAETGFVYLRARYYDPATGQFLSRDPLIDVTQDPYGYTGNNPINRTDPTGENWLSDRASEAVSAAGNALDSVAPVVRNVASGTNFVFSTCAAFVKNAVCSGGAAISAGVQAAAGTYMYARGDLSRRELALDYLNVATSTLGYKLDKGAASLSAAASSIRADRASRIAWSSNISGGFGRLRTATTLPMAWRASGLQFSSNLFHAGSVLMNGIGLGASSGSYLAGC